MSSEPHKILVRRYSGSARLNHWTVAISFIVLLLSGFSLFHPSLFIVGETLFGSGQTMRWLHPWAGVVLMVSFVGLFVRFFPANLPHLDDFRWFMGLKHVLAGHDEFLPELGKYNAGQKIVFWSQAILTVTLFVTGLALWNANLPLIEQYTGIQLTIEQRRWAAVIHATSAVLTVLVWIVHVYAAIWVRGTMPAMTSGNVTGGWAWRHHRRWLRREVKKPSAVTVAN
jgi:formate dehydrogenase subunit gamma